MEKICLFLQLLLELSSTMAMATKQFMVASFW